MKIKMVFFTISQLRQVSTCLEVACNHGKQIIKNTMLIFV